MPASRAVELIGLPFSSRAPGDGIARGIEALRSAGLAEALQEATALHDAGDLPLSEWQLDRAASGLLNEAGMVELVEASREAVTHAQANGRRPLLVGGDCPAMLGPLLALRDAGVEPGLLMLDGHEDAWAPPISPTGEASDSELGIALGLFDGMPAALGPQPLLQSSRTALIGPRDRAELEANGVVSLESRIAMLVPPEEVGRRGPEALVRAALAAIRDGPWWLHIDFDVLTTEAFPAADYPQNGGLGWDELAELAALALAGPGCAGASMVIYNADLDPDRAVAGRTIEFIRRAYTEPSLRL